MTAAVLDTESPSVAVHTVFIARENILFLKEWLAYHAMLGVEHFFLYDNTGSRGRRGSTSTTNAYGIDFHRATRGLSDAEVVAVRDAILDQFGSRVTLVDWQPRDAQGTVVYGNREAIVDCVARAAGRFDWLGVIDMDEYLFSPAGVPLRTLLSEYAAGGASRVVVQQKKFSDRFLNLSKRVLDIESCIEGIDTSHWAPKNLIRPQDFDATQSGWNVHGLPVRRGDTAWAAPSRLRFNHYNVNPVLLDWMQGFYRTGEPFSLNAVDTGMRCYRARMEASCDTFASPEWRRLILELGPS